MSYIVFGVDYVNKEEACKHFGVGLSTVYKWSKQGLSNDDVFKKILANKSGTTKSYVVLGVDYITQDKALKEYGVSSTTINDYLKEGLSVDQAFQKVLDGRHYYVLGIDYGTRVKACEELGVEYGKVKWLINVKKLSIDEAFQKAIDDLTKVPDIVYTINGVGFATKKEVYDYFGIQKHDVVNRMKYNNLSFEETVLCVLEKSDCSKDSDKHFCLENGLDYKKFSSYIQQGYTKENIYQYLYMLRDKAFTYEGVNYNSLVTACKSIGIDRVSLVSRVLKQGLSFKDAVDSLFEDKKFVLKGYTAGSKREMYKLLGFKSTSNIRGDEFESIFNRNRVNADYFESPYIAVIKKSYCINTLWYFQCIVNNGHTYMSAYELLDYILECLYEDGKIEKVLE